jgi:hypothetical protein
VVVQLHLLGNHDVQQPLTPCPCCCLPTLPQAQQKAAVAQGKSPFYLKKSELRKRELMQRYTELKSSGKLDKYMEKRRKRNAAKDHRYVPSKRRNEEEVS